MINKSSSIIIIYTIIVLLNVSCHKKICTISDSNVYELVLENEIFVEQFDQSITEPNRYNANNKIYSICNKLKYSFYHEDLEGNKFYFELNDGALDIESPIERNKAWVYVPENEITSSTITTFEQTIKSGLEPFIDRLPDYNQTVFDYFYRTNSGDRSLGEITGLIENENNVWMHPPRQMMFRILELNPFPFIQAPYEIGTTWEWNYLRPSGEEWGDKRWLVWEGNLDMRCEYEIIDFKKINTPLGELDCYKIKSSAINEYGSTELISYFNTNFGFVKLIYTNINQTKTIIELEEYKKF